MVFSASSEIRSFGLSGALGARMVQAEKKKVRIKRIDGS
jgi:hypothetical protein